MRTYQDSFLEGTMANYPIDGAESMVFRVLTLNREKYAKASAPAKIGMQSFNSMLSESITHQENSGEQSLSDTNTMQHEVMKLVVMLQHQMNTDFFNAFYESDPVNPSYDDSMNWIKDVGIGDDMDLSLSKIQQHTNTILREPDYSAPGLDGVIERASETYDVDADLIRAVIKAESNFDPEATSPNGAMGLMQLMPETANELGVKNAYDPVENIHAGTRYLKNLLDRYEGNIPLSLAAYNWGMGNVEKPTSRIPRETQDYIARVNRYYQKAKA